MDQTTPELGVKGGELHGSGRVAGWCLICLTRTGSQSWASLSLEITAHCFLPESFAKVFYGQESL